MGDRVTSLGLVLFPVAFGCQRARADDTQRGRPVPGVADTGGERERFRRERIGRRPGIDGAGERL
ncbi:MAG: hypothetical protein IRY86_13820 [Thermorudis peleae]|nr:hypothetical protein [Thermorudis peleae]